MNYKDKVFNLQRAINFTGTCTIVCNTNQFFSRERRKPINIYSIKMVTYNNDKLKQDYTEVFKTAIQLYEVFFLRNLLFTIQGKEIPETQFPDFEVQWKKFKQDYDDGIYDI